jgi:DNA repair protein NreA
MASKPVDVEIFLQDKPKFRMNFGEYTAPTGPNAKLKKAEITSNPKIDNKVEKIVDDSDLKANQGIVYLYNQGFDENFLSRMLSIGNVGLKKDRKLVPTRWSITAVDDALGKDLIKKIHDNSLLDYRMYFGGFLGNYYCLLFFPEVWSYELFEMEAKQQKDIQAMTDNESYNGRKEYAFNTAGGYYTVRLAILEKLNEMKRQGSCLALRFITDEYKLPLGVWVTREAARKTLNEKAMTFSSKELMLSYVQGLVLKKFGMNIGQVYRKSKLLNEIKSQKKLSIYI